MPDALLIAAAGVANSAIKSAINSTAGEPAAPLERLDPPTRMVVVMAILGLVLLGLLLILMTMVGARWVRRISLSKSHAPGVAPAFKSQAAVVPDLEQRLGSSARKSPSETITSDPSEDTVAD